MGKDSPTLFGPSFPERPLETGAYERLFREEGFLFIAGTDEAGRGALAGPVVAAAVILPESYDLPGLNDSKKLDRRNRERLSAEIPRAALAWAVGLATAGTIDRVNILNAALGAMLKACNRLTPAPDLILVDGSQPLPTATRQYTLKQGDGRCASIAAASILAKVYRDRLMALLERKYPGYGFADHKGYGAQSHLDALRTLGPSPVHRRSFKPLSAWLASEEGLFGA